MQTWESLFGIEVLDQGTAQSASNNVDTDNTTQSGRLSLRTGLQSALNHVANERAAGKIVFPPQADVFNAFKLTNPENLKVVILGQDPYHGLNQSHGLCFSVLHGNKIPPSLRNIYKELATDIPHFETPAHGNLRHWAKQGVLLLNTVLTVEQARANSHKNIGWEQFTDGVISTINSELDNVIFLLWGAPAQKKSTLIDESRHTIFTSVHPSPLSAYRGFFGCRHFSLTNKTLTSLGKHQIDWQPK
jgi:uracil-DNA glycosylase